MLKFGKQLIIYYTNLYYKVFTNFQHLKFEKSKASYVKYLAKPPKSLRAQFIINDRELINRSYKFNRRNEQAEKLKEISRKEFIQFFKGTHAPEANFI